MNLVYLQGDEPLVGGELSRGELRYLVEHEAVLSLADVVLRRTDLAFRGLVDAVALRALADALGTELGWSDARRSREVEEVARHLVVPTSSSASSAETRAVG